jgi:Cu2+-exporting ATPase
MNTIDIQQHNKHQGGHGSAHGTHTNHTTHSSGQGAHVDHTGHELMFRNRFWVCLALTGPVLLYSPALQAWLNFSMPAFPGSQWIGPLFAIIIFLYTAACRFCKWPRRR